MAQIEEKQTVEMSARAPSRSRRWARAASAMTRCLYALRAATPK